MHLKRDTEYALRIMVFIAEYLKENRDRSGGIPCSFIIAGTGTPVIAFKRVIGLLEENALIIMNGRNKKIKEVFPGRDFWKQSIFSIADAVEGNMEIFALFDRNSYLTHAYYETLKTTQDKLTRALSDITLAEMVCDG